MKTKSLGFIGGGRITKIILTAFGKSGTKFDTIVVSEVSIEVQAALKAKFPEVIVGADNLKEVVACDVLIVALHPPMIMETLSKIKGLLSEKTVLISLAPKLTIEKISSALGGFANIARMNPSASTIVNKGVNPVTFSPKMEGKTKETILNLLKPLGTSPVVVEPKIEAYAMIAAMGHTYYFFQLQKLKELAVSYGMDEDEARNAITEMLWGTTDTLFKSGLSYPEVIDLVPLKPLADVEETINGYYDQYLNGLYNKIKP